VPSRIDVEQYQHEKSAINQIVGKINGTYGDIHWTPVIYQYRAVEFEQLAALYQRSDVGLITPLRDGMNLVAKEYIASKTEKRGVLILSEMAGAALELGEAVIINPNHREEIAEAILTALEMPRDEQAKRVAAMQERLKKYDVKKWVEDFLSELDRVTKQPKKSGAILLAGREMDNVLYRFRKADLRMLFLDHDGTMVPFTSTPEEAAPRRRNFHMLKALLDLPHVRIIIISGRLKEDLEKWYGRLDVTLIAEHGAFVKEPDSEWHLSRPLDNSWKPGIIQILEKYRDRLPGSFIEEKEYSVVWHYRNADRAPSELRVREFVDDMVRLTARNEIEILMGNKVVEVKSSGMDKGIAAGLLLGEKKSGFVMAAGDDETDETMFKALPEGSVCIRIGRKTTSAGYYMESSRDFMDMLELFAGPHRTIIDKLRGIFTRR
ncbi:MAG: trehalose-phosphatase, partial [Spirochaetaceae bacterium]